MIIILVNLFFTKNQLIVNWAHDDTLKYFVLSDQQM